MLAALWQGELVAAVGAVSEDGIPDRKSPGSKRRRYHRSGCGIVIRIYSIFQSISLNPLLTEAGCQKKGYNYNFTISRKSTLSKSLSKVAIILIPLERQVKAMRASDDNKL